MNNLINELLNEEDREQSDDIQNSSKEKSKTNEKQIIYDFIQGRKFSKLFQNELKKSKINYIEHVNKHIMYLFITNVDNGQNDIIIKIGYSYDIIKRIEQLKASHGIICYVLRAIEVNGESDEVKFHSAVKKCAPRLLYKENIFPKKTKKNQDEEFYFGTTHLLETFDKYSSNIVLKKSMEQEKTKQKALDTKQMEYTKDIFIKIQETETKKMEIDIEKGKVDIEKGKMEIEKGKVDIEKKRLEMEKGKMEIEKEKVYIEKKRLEMEFEMLNKYGLDMLMEYKKLNKNGTN